MTESIDTQSVSQATTILIPTKQSSSIQSSFPTNFESRGPGWSAEKLFNLTSSVSDPPTMIQLKDLTQNIDYLSPYKHSPQDLALKPISNTDKQFSGLKPPKRRPPRISPEDVELARQRLRIDHSSAASNSEVAAAQQSCRPISLKNVTDFELCKTTEKSSAEPPNCAINPQGNEEFIVGNPPFEPISTTSEPKYLDSGSLPFTTLQGTLSDNLPKSPAETNLVALPSTIVIATDKIANIQSGKISTAINDNNRDSLKALVPKKRGRKKKELTKVNVTSILDEVSNNNVISGESNSTRSNKRARKQSAIGKASSKSIDALIRLSSPESALPKGDSCSLSTDPSNMQERVEDKNLSPKRNKLNVGIDSILQEPLNTLKPAKGSNQEDDMRIIASGSPSSRPTSRPNSKFLQPNDPPSSPLSSPEENSEEEMNLKSSKKKITIKQAIEANGKVNKKKNSIKLTIKDFSPEPSAPLVVVEPVLISLQNPTKAGKAEMILESSESYTVHDAALKEASTPETEFNSQNLKENLKIGKELNLVPGKIETTTTKVKNDLKAASLKKSTLADLITSLQPPGRKSKVRMIGLPRENKYRLHLKINPKPIVQKQVSKPRKKKRGEYDSGEDSVHEKKSDESDDDEDNEKTSGSRKNSKVVAEDEEDSRVDEYDEGLEQ
ncbi:hypothetical protein BY996DRAFT_4362670 [Phakopsora pachyrhizi]|nr:hypothetical protein BY996DRAFT_4362670 [Phakopsora pachyrhizi]